MRALWMFHRRLVVTVVIVGCLGVSTGLVVAGSHRGTPPTGTERSPDTAGSTPSEGQAGPQAFDAPLAAADGASTHDRRSKGDR